MAGTTAALTEHRPPTSDDDDDERAPGISPLTAVVVLLTLGAIVFAIWVGNRRADDAVWRLTSDLPSHHVLTERDLELSVQSSDGRFAHDAVGHMTIRALSRGVAIREADLGVDVAEQLGGDAVVVGIATTRVGAVAGSVHSGDRVELIAQQAGRIVSLKGIVMAVSVEKRTRRRPYAVAVALRRADARRQRWLGDASDIRIVKQLSPGR